ncbi:MAG: hypothetical protein NTZ05_10720, partial [Chloroflexi bacterium]|nr:hypothetical protein [Chloroflexota bacterium]
MDNSPRVSGVGRDTPPLRSGGTAISLWPVPHVLLALLLIGSLGCGDGVRPGASEVAPTDQPPATIPAAVTMSLESPTALPTLTASPTRGSALPTRTATPMRAVAPARTATASRGVALTGTALPMFAVTPTSVATPAPTATPLPRRRQTVSLAGLASAAPVPPLPSAFAPPVPDVRLQEIIAKALDGADGSYSVVVHHLVDGRYAAIEPDQQYHTASLFKLAVLATAFR